MNPVDLGIALNLMHDGGNSPGRLYAQLDLEAADGIDGAKWTSSHYPEYKRSILAADAMKGSPDTKCLLYWNTPDGKIAGGKTTYRLAVNNQVGVNFILWAGIGTKMDRAQFYISPPPTQEATPRPGGDGVANPNPTEGWTPPPTPQETPYG